MTAYLLGKLYEAREKKQGARPTSGHDVQKWTRDEVAGEVGVDGRTVSRAAQFARNVDALAEIDGATV